MRQSSTNSALIYAGVATSEQLKYSFCEQPATHDHANLILQRKYSTFVFSSPELAINQTFRSFQSHMVVSVLHTPQKFAPLVSWCSVLHYTELAAQQQ
jgi:hypothetical protein